MYGDTPISCNLKAFMASRSPNGNCRRSFTDGGESNKKLKGNVPVKVEKLPSYVRPQEPGKFSRIDQGTVSNCKDVVDHLNACKGNDVTFLTKVHLLMKPENSYHVIAQAAAALEGRFVEFAPETRVLNTAKNRLRERGSITDDMEAISDIANVFSVDNIAAPNYTGDLPDFVTAGEDYGVYFI